MLSDEQAGANLCGEAGGDPHGWVWTWPIEGGSGSVGVCCLCGAVTTGERDAVVASDAARAARDEADRRLELLRLVVAYDNANQSDLPLPLLDGIRAEVGGPR